MLKNLETKEGKVEGIVLNTVLHGFHAEEDYDYFNEAMEWSKSKRYFPHLSEEETLEILRKYEIWNEFEATCKEY